MMVHLAATKFTSASACHIKLRNDSSLSVSFWHFLTAEVQNGKVFWTSFLSKPFCKIYNGMDEEYVLHLTLVLLYKSCFSPPITDQNDTVSNRGKLYCPVVY